MEAKKPSEEYLEFLRKYREEEIRFLSENNLILKYDKNIEYRIAAGFTPQEIEESFKGMSLFNEKNLNL
jgi:hypothetical protein